jgi:Protein of unknown function (DUF3052)
MGAEAKCRLHVGSQVHEGVALLETDELLFRGSVRLKIPLRSISDVSASDGRLVVRHANDEAVFELGAAATRWAEKIRSPRSLLDKLDVKPGHGVSVVGVRDEDFLRQLADRAGKVTTGRFAKASDVIILGAENAKALDRLPRALESITPDGAIWVVHPKGKGSTLKDTEIFGAAKRLGLTCTKVARFSETHTAEKLVIPVAKRARK